MACLNSPLIMPNQSHCMGRRTVVSQALTSTGLSLMTVNSIIKQTRPWVGHTFSMDGVEARVKSFDQANLLPCIGSTAFRCDG